MASEPRELQRYQDDVRESGCCVCDDNGAYVLHAGHIAKVAEMQKEAERLRGDLLKTTNNLAAELQDKISLREQLQWRPIPEGTTHWETCWKDVTGKHGACALERIARLEAENEDLKAQAVSLANICVNSTQKDVKFVRQEGAKALNYLASRAARKEQGGISKSPVGL